MYIPAINQWKDRDELLCFMRAHSFALLVHSGEGGRPEATHLPFVVEEEGDDIFLTAHFARANPQWKFLEQGESLVVFSGPHAYISPQHYEKAENVPTWNYLAVHAYGKGELVRDENEGYRILEVLMQQSEPGFLQQWRDLPEGYRSGLFKGIVPFRIRVEQLQGKQKLSQNKTAEERDRIIDSLSASSYSEERALAEAMEAARR